MNNNSTEAECHDTLGERLAKLTIFIVVFVAVFATIYVSQT